MGSCSFNNSIQVFSITTWKTYYKYYKNRISSLDWNYNDSLIMNSFKNAYIYAQKCIKEVFIKKLMMLRDYEWN